MVIDKIGNINNIIDSKNSRVSSNKKDVNKNDSLEISSEGKKAAEIARYTQIVKETPDIRIDKVKQLKEQIKDGTYDKFSDNKILEMVADKIAENLIRK